MKTLLSILFLFVCAFAHAQYHNVEGIRVVGRGDSTTISNVGQIQFDADDDKFRFNDGTGWFSFLKEGATLPYWPLTGSGTLTGNTTINGDGKSLTIGSTTVDANRISSLNIGAGNASFKQDLQLNATMARIRYQNAAGDQQFALGVTGVRIGKDSASVVNNLWVHSNKTLMLMDDTNFRFLNSGQLAIVSSQPIFEGVGDSTTFRGDATVITSDDLSGTVTIHTKDGATSAASTSDVIIRSGHVTSGTGGVGDVVLKLGNQGGSGAGGSIVINPNYGDIAIDEDSDVMGIATLSSGTVTVNTTKVQSNSRIFLTVNGGTLTNVGTPYVSARSAGTSFTITSTNASDASDVAWIIINPAP